MLKKVAAAILITPFLILSVNAKDSKIEGLIIKLAEIDANLDKMIIKEEFKAESLNISEVKKEIETLLLNKTQLNTNHAKILWAYSSKIYLKIKNYLHQNSQGFRLAPSDLNKEISTLSSDAKEMLAASKWLYLLSKKSKR